MTPPFAPDGYAATIDGLIARGYVVRTFHDIVPAASHLVLRHDIDQSIARARVLAEIEAGRGWSATYFVLMRTEMYNPWSRAAVADLRVMCAAGHEVGLHLDASLYADSAALEVGAATESAALEAMLDRPVRLVSFHRPARHLLGGDAPIAGRLHVYMDRFFRDTGYCSDSRGGWHHGHPWDHAAVARRRALQLLTHPVWWIGPDGQDPRDRLQDVVAERTAAIEAEIAANVDLR